MDDTNIINSETDQKKGSVVAHSEQKRLTQGQAIKAWCYECSGWSKKEVRLCPRHDCPLYPYRFGTRLNDARVLQ